MCGLDPGDGAGGFTASRVVQLDSDLTASSMRYLRQRTKAVDAPVLVQPELVCTSASGGVDEGRFDVDQTDTTLGSELMSGLSMRDEDGDVQGSRKSASMGAITIRLDTSDWVATSNGLNRSLNFFWSTRYPPNVLGFELVELRVTVPRIASPRRLERAKHPQRGMEPLTVVEDLNELRRWPDRRCLVLLPAVTVDKLGCQGREPTFPDGIVPAFNWLIVVTAASRGLKVNLPFELARADVAAPAWSRTFSESTSTAVRRCRTSARTPERVLGSRLNWRCSSTTALRVSSP